ncbi:DUF4142 domain-containing protein [Parapedobacter sp. GCM10030251]|uniref:DUF4142 domain-containing protein n=1 Tax=Parapedobacter sp. GCM10030251 TaxID=3273419 RepID=UPI0036198455
MKLRNIFLMALPLVAAVSSCTRHAGEPAKRSLLLNNETNVDTEGYLFFKLAHEKAVYEVQLAKYVQSVGASAATKNLASKISDLYGEMIPELETLASAFHVVLPDPGIPGFSMPHHFATDSLTGFNNEAYTAHVQHEQGAILEHFNRVSRNTSKTLKAYANEKLPAVKEVFALAGGHEEHGAHH